MLRQLQNAAMMLLLMTILTGLLYPLAVTGIARVAFPHQAGGSLIQEGDKIVGSSLIGQSFDEPKYFWGRLSATGPYPYNAAVSSIERTKTYDKTIDRLRGRCIIDDRDQPADARFGRKWFRLRESGGSPRWDR